MNRTTVLSGILILGLATVSSSFATRQVLATEIFLMPLPKGESEVEAIPLPFPSIPQLAQAESKEPTPAPAPMAIPPEPVAADTNEKPADPLFQKRYDELNRPLTGVLLQIPSGPGNSPPNQAVEQEPVLPPIVLTGLDGWAEPRPNRYPIPFAYQPLYFEELNLERCGEGHGIFQPFVSSAAFVKNTIILPYQLVVSPPRSEEWTPGDCPSCYRFPRTCK